MKQFELKFTEENLQRHLSHDPFEIHTIRDELKGEVGDLTIIKSKIYFVGDAYTTTLRDIKKSSNDLWKKAGFQSRKEYVEEIQWIYGTDDNKRLYDMHLILLEVKS
jgi:hypothetical protein